MYIFSPTFSNLLVYFIVVTALALVILVIPSFLAPTSFSTEKLSAYECGFEPFVAPREVFESHFVVVAILFLIFDLEIIFLLPWVATGGGGTGAVGFWSVSMFLVLLLASLFYEWVRGGITWPLFFLFKKQKQFQ